MTQSPAPGVQEREGNAPMAKDANPRPKCDHICLLDDDHVERGERHFYGYEIPSPRASVGSVPNPHDCDECDGKGWTEGAPPDLCSRGPHCPECPHESPPGSVLNPERPEPNAKTGAGNE